MYYCYMLYTDRGQTYIGATTDVNRRLRQHNKEISGGARTTGIKVAQGLHWEIACYISGIPEWRSALQIEWRWKQLGRTQFKHIKNPFERRLYSLKYLLELDKPTANSIPYDCYPDGRPVINFMNDDIQGTYNIVLLNK